jgi:hypothetical protein
VVNSVEKLRADDDVDGGPAEAGQDIEDSNWKDMKSELACSPFAFVNFRSGTGLT